jgi:hypothetical protein
MSALCARYCCKSRKSYDPENLAKVDSKTLLLRQGSPAPIRRSVVVRVGKVFALNEPVLSALGGKTELDAKKIELLKGSGPCARTYAQIRIVRIHSEEGFRLRYRRLGVQKLGNGSDKLRWRKWLGQKDAVRNALSGPFISVGTGNIDDRQIRVDRSGAPGNIPPSYPVFA